MSDAVVMKAGNGRIVIRTVSLAEQPKLSIVVIENVVEEFR